MDDMKFEVNRFINLFGGIANHIDPYEFSISYAYRDLCRTLRGINKIENKEKIKRGAWQILISQVKILEKIANVNQEIYDSWHKSTCDLLIKEFSIVNFDRFTYGTAQKWINMTQKYLLCTNVDYYINLLPYFHIPIDNFILSAVKDWDGYNMVEFTEPWSTNNNYESYLKFQKWFRKFCDNKPPLLIEFKLWHLVKTVNVNKSSNELNKYGSGFKIVGHVANDKYIGTNDEGNGFIINLTTNNVYKRKYLDSIINHLNGSINEIFEGELIPVEVINVIINGEFIDSDINLNTTLVYNFKGLK